MGQSWYEIGNDLALMGDEAGLGEEYDLGDFMEIGADESPEDLLALAGAGPRRKLTALKAMLARNKHLLRSRGPTKARTYFLGFRTTVPVGAGLNAVVTERPQLPFRPERFIVPSDIAGSFEIADFRIGKNSQLVTAQAVPARTFQEDATNTLLGLDTAQVCQDITLSVNNIGGAALFFRATMIGAAVE